MDFVGQQSDHPVVGSVSTVATLIGRRRTARPAWAREEVDGCSGIAGGAQIN